VRVAQIESRIVGIIVICLELLIFTLPISILAFVPKFFFGSVLTFIAIDLIMSWLVLSYTLVHPWEYAIIWLTFIAICFTNLEEGMAIGVALSILGFILQYASAKATQRIHRSSNVQRGFAQRSNLAHHRSNIITFKLSGYIFFGSSLSMTVSWT
jgi:SulP family sulfate permease